MTRIKLRYYVIKRGKGFWQPTPKIKAHGFASVPCGVDGPDAWKIVEIWNNRWDAPRRGDVPSPAMAAATNLSPDQAEELSIYPSRSLGEAFRRYRRTDEWQRKAPRTREDWWLRGAASSLSSETVIREPLRLRISVRGARRSKTQCRSAKHIGQ